MRKVIGIAILSLALGGCAGLMREQPAIGDPLDTVRAKFGTPTAVYPAPEGQKLEYATGPMGQYTWMATIGKDGRLAAFEQVLTHEVYGRLKTGKSTKADVLHTLGRPAETSFLSLPQLEVWSYRYKESGVWNSMMHMHFDRGGVLTMMQSGPDPMYEEKRFMRD